MKNTNIKIYTHDLLRSEEFKNALRSETVHGIEIKGGHFPFYSGKQTRARLVNNINLLNEGEKLSLINGIFTSKN